MSGVALPAPLVPSRDTIGTKEVWFLSWILQARPEGDKEVVDMKSDASTYIINEQLLCVEPVGELKIPPGTTTISFFIMLN
jgi:hypothetical protein